MRVVALTEQHEAEICSAIGSDFGGRSAHETRLAELHVVRAGIRHARAHLQGWMRQRRVATSLPFLPGRNRLLPPAMQRELDNHVVIVGPRPAPDFAHLPCNENPIR